MEEEPIKTGVIYKVTSPNNKIYIGQTINFKVRCQKYKYKAFKGQIKLWNNTQKHNWNPVDNIEIIEVCSIIDLDDREVYWINHYDSYLNGLNSDLGGNGRQGFKHTEATKLKLRLLNLGRKHTDETKEKISFFNKTRPPEINAKIAKSNIGKKHTDETKDKIKNTKKNNPYKMTDEQRLKVSLSNIGNKNMLGKKHSDETKSRISKAKSGIPNSALSVKIICLNTGEVYMSQQDAADKLKLKQPSISKVCRKDRKSINGLVFMFYNEYLKNKDL